MKIKIALIFLSSYISYSYSMDDIDMVFHTTVTHTLYCTMEAPGTYKELEKIKPALIGMQDQRILEKYDIETITQADLSLAASYIAKTPQQKRLLCENLDRMMGEMNKQVENLTNR